MAGIKQNFGMKIDRKSFIFFLRLKPQLPPSARPRLREILYRTVRFFLSTPFGKEKTTKERKKMTSVLVCVTWSQSFVRRLNNATNSFASCTRMWFFPSERNNLITSRIAESVERREKTRRVAHSKITLEAIIYFFFSFPFEVTMDRE